MPSSANMRERLEKLENKVKLSNLLTGKKFADLELTVGNLDQKFKEISSDFPKLKERAGEIEDLLNVMNLGLREYKKNFSELSSRLSGMEKIPDSITKRMLNYEKKLNSLDENVKKLSETLTTLSTIKEDINETIRRTVSPSLEALRASDKANKLEMEHLKKNVDAFASVVKSFERTVELTNIDTIIKRFDVIDEKIIKTQTQLQDFRNTLHGLTLTEKDVAILKKKIDDLSAALLEKLGKLNEFETNVNILQQKINDLNLFGTVNEFKSSLSIRDKSISENKLRLEELTNRLNRLSNLVNKEITSYRRMITAPKKGVESKAQGVATYDQTKFEAAYTKIKEMYDEINKKISELKDLEERLKSSEAPSKELSTDSARMLTKMNEKIIILEKRHNELVDMIQSELKNMKGEIAKPSRTIDLRKEVDELEKVFLSRDKSLTEYKKQIENRLKRLESKKLTGTVPKDLLKELSSLKDITNQLLTENNEIRKLARELRISQMETVKTQTFATLADKVTTLEKKIGELEEMVGRPTAQVQPENLEKLNEEIESLKKILHEKESSIKSKISEIEKKMKEESGVQPVVLE